jgi:hypothetical protein
MTPTVPSNAQDPWETPPVALDPELVETSQRLVALSEDVYQGQPEVATDEVSDPRITELEKSNRYLLDRNAFLVAQLAQLETANLHLQQEISVLRKMSQTVKPWYRRWF